MTKTRDRPFEPEIWDRAKQIVKNYHVQLEQCDSVGWFGRMRELPNVMADGLTAVECTNETRKAADAAVAHMLETGVTPPLPIKD